MKSAAAPSQTLATTKKGKKEMSSFRIKLLLNIILFCQVQSIGQSYQIEFSKELIKKNEIKNLRVKVSRPNYLSYKGGNVFHSEYEFNEDGKVKSKIYLFDCGNTEKMIQCLIKDSFEYDKEENLVRKLQFHPNKKIWFDLNKPVKSDKKLRKKLKSIDWQNEGSSRLLRYDNENNLLSESILRDAEPKEIKLSEYEYECQNGEIVKKYYRDLETGNKILIDSIVREGNKKESFYIVENQIESKTTTLKNEDGSFQEVVYLKNEDKYEIWRTYEYDVKGRLTSEKQGKYLTEFKYNKFGLIEEVVEMMGKDKSIIKKLYFEYK